MAENEAEIVQGKSPRTATAKAVTVSTSSGVGLTTPFPEKDVVIEKTDGTLESKIPGVDPETLLFQGVDPETKERVTLTLEGLKAEFGDKLGEKKYLAIAGINQGSVFFQPKFEATDYRPPLGISGLTDPKLQQKVADILAAKE